MSTFDGILNEFPTIRVDNFRYRPDKPPPQACFLSHVHSDHLQGLETLKMPFVYCSMATKRILLRMEKYSHRMNFAKGILEVRKQTYKSLKLVLRELPLESPVEIELGPKTSIRVTLFDANHCPGAVMFLFEDGEKAALYTGDVRAEPWWVNSLISKPILLPYSCGAKRLDCIYLDTTFASRDRLYEEFPAKADGLKELLAKVAKCPKGSLFYVRSWTLGYEDVWIALSNFLQSPVHVDDYQLRIFKSLTTDVHQVDRGPVLAGFSFGNQYQLGCLTDDVRVAIHSCEPGTECHSRLKAEPDVVWIIPIVSRNKEGTELAEIGAGGGGGDLHQMAMLEMMDETSLQNLEKLFSGDDRYKHALSQLKHAFEAARAQGASEISIRGVNLDLDEEVSIKDFIKLVSGQFNGAFDEPQDTSTKKVIRFPYSRHSSFSELRHLISCFCPKDICPCTVDVGTWSDSVSMRSLFGDLCSEDFFRHDRQIALSMEDRDRNRGGKRKRTNTQDEQNANHDYDSQRSMHRASGSNEQMYASALTTSPQQTLLAERTRESVEDRRQPELEEVEVDRREKEQQQQQQQQQAVHDTISSTDLPTPVRRLHRTLSNRFEKELSSQNLDDDFGDKQDNHSLEEETSVSHPTTTATNKATDDSTWGSSAAPVTSPLASPPLPPLDPMSDEDHGQVLSNDYENNDDNEDASTTISIPLSTFLDSFSRQTTTQQSLSGEEEEVVDDDNDNDTLHDESESLLFFTPPSPPPLPHHEHHHDDHYHPTHSQYDDNDDQKISSRQHNTMGDHQQGRGLGTRITTGRKKRKTTTTTHSTPRIASRIAAYRAAKLALTDGIMDDWNDLGLRSVGWKGHTEEEREL